MDGGTLLSSKYPAGPAFINQHYLSVLSFEKKTLPQLNQPCLSGAFHTLSNSFRVLLHVLLYQ